jgi:hypothetical protein
MAKISWKSIQSRCIPSISQWGIIQEEPRNLHVWNNTILVLIYYNLQWYIEKQGTNKVKGLNRYQQQKLTT